MEWAWEWEEWEEWGWAWVWTKIIKESKEASKAETHFRTLAWCTWMHLIMMTFSEEEALAANRVSLSSSLAALAWEVHQWVNQSVHKLL
jgi:hypothetical protein